MADEGRQERDDGDDEGSEQNQYGGDQDVDAVERTERVEDDDEAETE